MTFKSLLPRELQRLEPGIGDPASSFSHCRAFLAHYENFTVGSRFFPKRLRPALAAIYAFARFSDDLADCPLPSETGLPAEQGLALRRAVLARWRELLEGEGEERHPILHALAISRREQDLPLSLFSDLLTAFARDLEQQRWQDREELLSYCRCSADPVGRLMLRLFGFRDPELDALSDSICTALQLVNFWQDFSRDLPEGRLYVPLADLRRHGLPKEPGAFQHAGPAAAPLLEELFDWAEELFARGESLPGRISGRLAFEVRLFIGGGRAVAARGRALGVDILRVRPHLSRLGKLAVGAGALRAGLFASRAEKG